MLANKCTIDWGTMSITTQKPTLDLTTQSEPMLPTTEKPHNNNASPIHVGESSMAVACSSNVLPPLVEASSKTPNTKPELPKSTCQWVPKTSSLPLPSISRTRSCKRQETRSKQVTITTRWVPKTLLKAQGYYEGNDKIWVPKHGVTSFVSHTPTCLLAPANPTLVESRDKGKMAEYPTLVPELVWVPKQAQSIPSSQGQQESQFLLFPLL